MAPGPVNKGLRTSDCQTRPALSASWVQMPRIPKPQGSSRIPIALGDSRAREASLITTRGKCASAIRAANKVVNKLIPLLKSDNSDLEPVKEYSVELHQYIALIVDTQEEFDSKFAGNLEILASFGEWLQPRFDVLKSVLEYSTAWIDSTTTMSEVPSGAGILPIDNDIEPEGSISQLSAARSRSDRHSNASSKSRSRVSKSPSLSHASSIKSARIKESLKKVTLMAEARNLVEKQTLLRKEFELSMEKQSLELSTSLAITIA